MKNVLFLIAVMTVVSVELQAFRRHSDRQSRIHSDKNLSEHVKQWQGSTKFTRCDTKKPIHKN